jgi:hypothetical protein
MYHHPHKVGHQIYIGWRMPFAEVARCAQENRGSNHIVLIRPDQDIEFDDLTALTNAGAIIVEIPGHPELRPSALKEILVSDMAAIRDQYCPCR